ncbi:hypothetical protein CYJ36_05910 [Bacillus sp. UMB0893]|nr:hypothetical protein CYJ36_05910 [Bacillus sp. UMB0893]
MEENGALEIGKKRNLSLQFSRMVPWKSEKAVQSFRYGQQGKVFQPQGKLPVIKVGFYFFLKGIMSTNTLFYEFIVLFCKKLQQNLA